MRRPFHPTALAMTANDALSTLDLLSWKPLASAWLLPPLPLLAIIIAGAWRLAARRSRSGWLLVFVGTAGIWLSQSLAIGQSLSHTLLTAAPALSPQAVDQMRRNARDVKRVVVVLGGGRDPLAPEYAVSHLGATSMQRLHYAIHLARRIDAPILYSGGVGHGVTAEPSEAETAQRIAERDYGLRLRWIETRSRDTRENARESLARLAQERGIAEIVLVTQGWHMQRAQRAFTAAAASWPAPPKIVAAPVSDHDDEMRPMLRWMPSPAGAKLVHAVLREWIGFVMGA